MGGIVLSPLGSWLVGIGGVSLAAPLMGLLVLAVGLPIALWVILWDPADVNLTADVGSPVVTANAAALGDDRVWTRAGAARTIPFWAILIAFLVVLMAQTGFLLHQIAFLEDRLGSREAAALALSTTAFGSVVARLLVGRFADQLDKVLVSVALFVIQGLAVLGVLAVQSPVATYGFVLIVGFTIGNIYMMQTLLIAEKFGLVSLGTLLGVVGLAVQVGSGIGPFVVGWMEEVSGSYELPFTISALATLASAVIVLAARLPVERRAVDRPVAGAR